ncbi:VOC family protein [Nocardia testacea]|uniref:VOC family protein n=1 Tax=Nocardia testacea TaxID=248551 RepID=A0ABW7VV56_9NOCA
MGDTAVPVLPTRDLARTLDFYRALGYTVTYEQTRPYVYGAISAYDCELHFTAAPAGHAAKKEAGCLVMVDDVADRHRSFSAALRERFGRIPAQGPGRITRFRAGQTRFSLIDPDSNWVIYIARTEPREVEYGGSAKLTGLARVLDNARILRDSKNDDKAAERALESGLRRHGAAAHVLDRARALAALAELAVARGNPDKAAERRADLAALGLTEAERRELAAELGAAADLEEWLRPQAD